MVDEKIISLNVINRVSTSTLRDDWIVLHVDSPEGDTILSCFFKTELMTHMAQQTGGRIKIDVQPQIQYRKKGNKQVTMKFVKDEKVKRDDVYKSHVVNVPSGEPANSRKSNKSLFQYWQHINVLCIAESFPPCATKPRLTTTSTRKTAAKKPAATRSAPRPVPAANRPVSNIQSSARAPPPPPPPPPASAPAPDTTPSVPQFKAIYPFQSQEVGEIAFEKDDILEILEKDENGWWLARKDGKEGWVPSNYLEEFVAPKATPPPPPPPARRPAPPAPSVTSSSVETKPLPQRTSISPPATSTTPIAVMPGMAAAPNSNGVPPWKAQLEARKAAAAAGSGNNNTPTPAPRPTSSSGTTPVPAARRAPPVPGPKPVIPAKPSSMSKPVVPARPGSGAPTPAPRAPPRPTSTSPPSNAAASLADAVSLYI